LEPARVLDQNLFGSSKWLNFPAWNIPATAEPINDFARWILFSRRRQTLPTKGFTWFSLH
jgi:hypothetical protein